MLDHQVKHTFPCSRHHRQMQAISDRIRSRRLELGMTQEALAQACGVTKQAVSQWEQDAGTTMTGPNLVSAAEALDVSERWLAFGKEPKERTPRLSTTERQAADIVSRLP